MNDFEERLARALRSAADRAPEPGVLSPRPRHRVTVLLAVAAVVVAVAVPIGVVAWVDRTGPGQPPVASTTTPAPSVTPSSTTPSSSLPSAAPSGWRVETWRNVTLRVPATWGEGDIRCTDGKVPSVQRPSDPKPACPGRGWGLGVAFLTPRSGLSPKAADPSAVVKVIDEPEASVVIVAPDAQTLAQIAASVHTFQGADPNGCPLTTSVPALGTAPGADSRLSGTRASVCWYALDWSAVTTGGGGTPGTLARSNLLTQSQTQMAIDALESAPVGLATATKERCSVDSEAEAVLMTFGTDQVWIHTVGCIQYGIDGVGPTSRKLTPQVSFWAEHVDIAGSGAPPSPHPTSLASR